MWMKWFPWRLIVRDVARKQGFLDPIALISRLQRFAQPSEVAAPTELLRSGAVLHARGLMNSQAIQHNLDWVWPYWVERQFNPVDHSFVPRAFSITHINLTHRNWTAVGIPDTDQWPIIDPRGLLTPLYDGWSLDAWIIAGQGKSLIPSRLSQVSQQVSTQKNLSVTTLMENQGLRLVSRTEVVGEEQLPVCQMTLTATSDVDSRLIISLRPYNPEGVSFIHSVEWRKQDNEWIVNEKRPVRFSDYPEEIIYSNYQNGDVYRYLPGAPGKVPGGNKTNYQECNVGMATAAAFFPLKGNKERTVTVRIPLAKINEKTKLNLSDAAACRKWEENKQTHGALKIPDSHFQFLYDAALRTLILHSPDDVFPGPFTYKRFWFRDAAFILHAMLCAGLVDRVERVLDRFPAKQKQFGYFLSQDGEWDSNGEALWILQQFCRLTGRKPKAQWRDPVIKGGQWIHRKRLSKNINAPHAGLLPAGFSAEHFGPNDYYYWDDFWGVAGLRAASQLAGQYGDTKESDFFNSEAQDLYRSVESSLKSVFERMGKKIVPASPYRRMDAGAIGSLVSGYPLQLCSADDQGVMNTVEFLIENCMVNGGFFQDMTHSGINPYLTLHMAQVLLRAGDPRYFDLVQAVAKLASPTGQWPEAIHPRTGGGCMGDGQHVWAAAEWVMMIKNCFLREEEKDRRLILCSGIPQKWLKPGEGMFFGPAHTSFGTISILINTYENGKVEVSWKAEWFKGEPGIDICLPGYPKASATRGQATIRLSRGGYP